MDIMYYKHYCKHFDSPRFGIFPVEGHSERIVVNGKTQVSMYGA